MMFTDKLEASQFPWARDVVIKVLTKNDYFT